jgi:hypothetical protein
MVGSSGTPFERRRLVTCQRAQLPARTIGCDGMVANMRTPIRPKDIV